MIIKYSNFFGCCFWKVSDELGLNAIISSMLVINSQISREIGHVEMWRHRELLLTFVLFSLKSDVVNQKPLLFCFQNNLTFVSWILNKYSSLKKETILKYLNRIQVRIYHLFRFYLRIICVFVDVRKTGVVGQKSGSNL